MTISTICLIAAMAIILLFTSSNLQKIQGYKIFDRIDIHCEIQAVPFSELSQMQPGEPSATIRERVIRARKIQEERFKSYKGIHCNAQMTERMLHEFAEPDAASLDMLRMAMERLKLSARAYSRILKVARTIADLAGSEKVQSVQHILGHKNVATTQIYAAMADSSKRESVDKITLKSAKIAQMKVGEVKKALSEC